MKDVARAAGVSAATVSFVLNETPGQTIRPETSQRVRDAARALGYKPHSIGRALREGASRVVVLDVGPFAGGNSLDSFIAGMADEVSKCGHVLFVHHGEPDALLAVIDAINPRAVVDVLHPFANEEPASPDGGWAYGLAAHTFTQFRYLVERGHKRIAFAAPEASPLLALVSSRLEHMQRACTELGIQPAELLTVSTERLRVAEAIQQLLVENPDVSAIAAFDDDVALGVLGAMNTLRLHAPKDLAVIGFDDTAHGALWSPRLTTVHIDAETYGRRAARSALGQTDGQWPAIPSTVIARDSA
ncbi:LacI family transcriptional regulator [Arthrobacter sp. MN05-02]|nr:LacI family transcriptional regulator [Arthrobacter sp. MN05-02]